MKILIIALILGLSGCASVRPQARIIDGTNKGPIFSRSVEKTTDKDDHKHKWNKNNPDKLDKHKERSKSKTTSWDFTF